MAALADKFIHHAPVLWLEVGPPRGINPEPLLRRLAALVGQVDAINLTDNALGKVKMSSIAFGTIIKLRLGLPVVRQIIEGYGSQLAVQSELGRGTTFTFYLDLTPSYDDDLSDLTPSAQPSLGDPAAN